MGSFLDNADGCNLTFQKLRTKVPFPTSSDALFAAFYFKYAEVKIRVFDDILSLLQHPAFDSKELTLRVTEDLYDHVSNQRMLDMETRQLRGMRIKKRNRSMPALILDLLVEYLDSVRMPFHEMVSLGGGQCPSDQILRTMALVHRSWTDPAQRVLRRRVLVTGQKAMRLLLQSPFLGPWVRDLSVKLSNRSRGGKVPDDNVEKENPRLLGRILSKCTGVKILDLEDPLQPKDVQPSPSASSSFLPANNIICEISELAHLEHLWINQHLDPVSWQLHAIPIVLSRLRHLQGLEITHWPMEPSRLYKEELSQLRTQLASAGLMPSLGYLSLKTIRNKDLLGWLLKPSDSYRPSTLALSFVDTRFIGTVGAMEWDPRPFLAQLGPYVTKLMLTDFITGDDIMRIIEHLPKLRTLSICLDSFADLPYRIFLPMPLHRLRIHCHVASGNQDEALASWLRYSPQVREVFISCDGSVSQYFGSSTPTFRLTSAYCKDKKIEFTATYGAPPTYFDI